MFCMCTHFHFVIQSCIKAANIKRIPLDMQISQYEAVQTHAKAHGESVNGFIKRAIQETMMRDNQISAGE